MVWATTQRIPELLSYFEAADDEGEENVISKRHQMTHRGLIAQYRQIRFYAGVAEYPKLFQNLRSTRQTELFRDFPAHVVCSWIGNSQQVALKHYLQVTDDDFDRACKKSELNAEGDSSFTQNLTQLVRVPKGTDEKSDFMKHENPANWRGFLEPVSAERNRQEELNGRCRNRTCDFHRVKMAL
jgi:hypothetical protein